MGSRNEDEPIEKVVIYQKPDGTFEIVNQADKLKYEQVKHIVGTKKSREGRYVEGPDGKHYLKSKY